MFGKINKSNGTTKIFVSTAILTFYFEILFILRLSYNIIQPSVISVVLSLCFFGFLSYFIIRALIWIFSNKSWKKIISLMDKIEKKRVISWFCDDKFFFLKITAVTFLVLLVVYLANYPGGAANDTIYQYSQAVGESPYSNWHPFIHTLLFFIIPLKTTDGGLPVITLLQVIYFSAAFGYLIYVLKETFLPKSMCLIFCLYIWMNPYIHYYLMFPFKDIAFALLAMVLAAYYVRVIVTKGEWLERIRNIILFSIFSVLAVYIRHNAVLFVAPLVFIILFYSKKWLARGLVIISCIVVYVSVFILYNVMDVRSPGNRKVEMIGMPVSVWCHMMKNRSEELPEDVKDTLYSFASQETYNKYDAKKGFNSIKFSGEIDKNKIEKLSYKEVFDITYKCFRADPFHFLVAISSFTDYVWDISEETVPVWVYIEDNSLGLKKNRIEIFTNIYHSFQFIFPDFLNIILGNYGFMIIIMIVLAAVMFALNRMSFIHVAPLICYNFGTMLLLSGHDYRLFLLNIPVWPVTIYIMLKDKREFSSKRTADTERK